MISDPPSSALSRANQTHWRVHLVGLAMVLTFAAWCFGTSYYSMFETWMRSDTFAHGFFILPISLYLIWSRREMLISISPQTDLRMLLVLPPLVVLWLLAKFADVIVVQQFMALFVLWVLIAATLGLRVVWAICFPLLYLLFAVPFGEFLIPIMREFTAEFTVSAVRATGVPVFFEGLFLSTPAGHFEVAEACSGVRYLIASLALGTLYAYLSYTHYYKRILFILLSIVIPILANGVRAFAIVMIATWSELKFATGVDHIIYGWIFFGVVMLLLYWIGSWWTDPPVATDTLVMPIENSAQSSSARVWIMVVVAVALMSPTVWWQSRSDAQLLHHQTSATTILKPWQPIVLPASEDKLGVRFTGAAQQIHGSLNQDNQLLYWTLIQYDQQSQGHELIAQTNLWYDRKQWRLIAEQTIPLSVNAQQILVQEKLLTRGHQKLRVWHWYRIGDQITANEFRGKLHQAWSRFLAKSEVNEAWILAQPVSEFDESSQILERVSVFLIQHATELNLGGYD